MLSIWTEQTRGRMAEIERKTKRYPTDLTDEEWAGIEPFLPRPARTGRGREVDLREVVNAIRYVARTGVRLADAAEGFSAVADRLMVVPSLGPTGALSPDPHDRRYDRPRVGRA